MFPSSVGNSDPKVILFSLKAVQHERGPRKPKLHLLNAASAGSHHHHHHHHHPNSGHNGQTHSNFLALHGNHHHGPLSDSNHPLAYHHPAHLHPHNHNHQSANSNGPQGVNPLITNVSASFNYTHLSHHHHHQPPFTGPNFPHPPNNNNNSNNIPIHHPQPLPFNSPLNGATSLLAPHKLEPNQSSAFEVPQLTIKNSVSDQESHYTRKSDEDSAISPTHTIKSSTSPSLSSPDHIIMVDRPSTGMRSLKESNGNNSEDAASPRSPSVANIGSASSGGQRQTDVLEILMRSDKCQEFLQYQMQNSLFFPQSTFWPPPPPLLPLPPPAAAVGERGQNNNNNNSTVPSPTNLPSWEVLQETTARLLFMAVRWVRCLVPFQTLSKTDQHLLLQVRV